MTIMDQCKLLSKDMRTCWHLTTDSDEMILKLHLFHKMCDTFRPYVSTPLIVLIVFSVPGLYFHSMKVFIYYWTDRF